jgi:hypothetical protein
MEAYEDSFRHTSTTWAPWYVVPADPKPYCRLLVAFLIYQSLQKMKQWYASNARHPAPPRHAGERGYPGRPALCLGSGAPLSRG